MSKILLEDRFVGTFGTVPAGDRSLITKIAVEAARRGFGVVPMQADAVNPACALGVRDAKKEHECYHVLTSDTKVRAAFNRLTKDDGVVNLAIDVAASGIGWCHDVSDWWVGPPISPTMLGLDGDAIYVFELTDPRDMNNPHLHTTGTLLVPPTADDESGDYIQLIGQMNRLSDNVRTEIQEEATVAATENEETVVVNPDKDEFRMEIADTLWNNDPQDLAALTERLSKAEQDLVLLKDGFGKLQNALVVALTTLKELRDNA